MRHGRLIPTAAVIVAAMAAFPALASAASFVDDSTADFGAGNPGAATAVVDPGSVALRRTLVNEDFSGAALPADLSFTQWTSGSGTATVGSGTLSVDGGRVNGARVFGPGQILEFRAAFAGPGAGTPLVPHESIGLGDTLADGPWAIFSTGSGANLKISTLNAAGGTPVEATAIDGLVPGEFHDFRIEWSATDVKYFVDNAPVGTAQPFAPNPAELRPVVSDFDADVTPMPVKVSALGMRVYATTPGAYESPVHDAGDTRALWGALTATATTPASTNLAIETRSGNTPTPDGSWSTYTPLGTSSAIQSPSARYIQYRATLSNTTDNSLTPSLDKVQIRYDVDTTAPTATIDGVQVSGTTARVSFSSPDADTAAFQCSLDTGAFAACASPKELAGLSVGAHTVSVRPIDKVGNVGSPVSRSFNVAASTSSSGTSGTVDKTAPNVTLLSKSLRASKRGTVGVKVGCPATETSCKITVQLMRGKTVAAKKTVTVKGGKTKTVTLQLTKTIRRQLSSHHSLKVTAVLSAKDAAGNQKTTKKSLTLRG
jgi:hypothetical protein